MINFIILRHGLSKFNKARIFQGQYDVELDEIGVAQAERNAEYIVRNYRIDKIVSSDLSRAYCTAKPIADRLGLPIETMKDLREIDVGRWSGCPIADIEKLFPEDYAHYRKSVGDSRPTGGESLAELRARVKTAFERIAKENDGKTVLVTTHGGVIRAIVAEWTGVPYDEMRSVPIVRNASITLATYDNGVATFSQIGENAHLGDLATEGK